MPMRNVWAATWPEVRLKVIVVGLLAPRNWIAGKLLAAVPMENVFGPQLLFRGSWGCIWEMLLPLRNSFGDPSQVPTFQSVVGCESADVRFSVALPPLVTLTLAVATPSSPW